MTKDRKRIIDQFQSSRTWTAAQLHAELGGDLSTIYRNLTKLTKADIIKQAHVHDGKTHYELASKKHHDHSICKKCEIIKCIPCPAKHLPIHNLELIKLCFNCVV